MREVKVIQTEDGSSSLFVPELNETYHSFHGALGESMHVFIKMGLEHWMSLHPNASSIHVFEVGFGTGLNALLTYAFAQKHQIMITYTTLEPYPISFEVAENLNYGSKVEEGKYQELFMKLHHVEWNQEVQIDKLFLLNKQRKKLEEFEEKAISVDLVYFDAFAPNKQAELWEKAVLQKTAGLMRKEAVLTTYCAKGQLKRDLATVGLQVETLPGAPGKKEMVRASKPSA